MQPEPPIKPDTKVWHVGFYNRCYFTLYQEPGDLVRFQILDPEFPLFLYSEQGYYSQQIAHKAAKKRIDDYDHEWSVVEHL